jgi:hypothetical protein
MIVPEFLKRSGERDPREVVDAKIDISDLIQ